MKHLKLTSVLLSVAMCMTMAVTPVMADETAPEQSQTTEETQEKEPEEQEAAPSNEDEKEAETVKGQLPEEKEQTEAEDAYLAKGKCGKKVKWTLDKKGTLKITGKGAMNNFTMNPYTYSPTTPWVKYSKKIKKVVFSKNVTTVGAWSFLACENLTSVSLPKKLRSIGDVAFAACGKLKSISLPKSLKTIGIEVFCESGIESVTIPNGVTEIPYAAFADSALKSITIPASVTKIGDDAFNDCPNLKTVKIPVSGLNSIGERAFRYTGITSFDVPLSVSTYSIGERAFAECGNLEKVWINKKQLDTTPKNAFDGSTKVKFDINTYAIVGDPFNDDENGFSYQVINPAINGSGTVALTGINKDKENVAIPAVTEYEGVKYKVTLIRINSQFNDALAMKTLVIGSNITSIPSNAFSNCPALESVTGGSNLKMMGSKAFANCPNLKVFNISSKTLKKIGDSSFEGDTALTTLLIRNTTKLTKAGVKNSLKGSSVKTVRVKKKQVKKYKKFFKTGNCGKKVTVKK